MNSMDASGKCVMAPVSAARLLDDLRLYREADDKGRKIRLVDLVFHARTETFVATVQVEDRRNA